MRHSLASGESTKRSELDAEHLTAQLRTSAGKQAMKRSGWLPMVQIYVNPMPARCHT